MTKLSVSTVLFAIALSACNRGANDDRITARVNERLASEPQPLSVRIETDNRIVTLKGVVMSPSEHERIVGAVRSVEGVVAVDDQLVVQSPVTTTGSELDHDRELVGLVSTRLEEAGFGDLRVDAAGGVVTVAGAVSHQRHDEMLRVVQESSPAVRAIEDETTVLIPSR